MKDKTMVRFTFVVCVILCFEIGYCWFFKGSNTDSKLCIMLAYITSFIYSLIAVTVHKIINFIIMKGETFYERNTNCRQDGK